MVRKKTPRGTTTGAKPAARPAPAVAHLAVEARLAHGTELFDLAPIGCFVLAAGGAIREANLAGARLLRVERRRLVGRDLPQYVAEGDRERFAEFLARVRRP